ncbi:Dynamin- GTPase protein [Coelomomyces lativittatus]|nr:Dynamin- GTPase protein [Coelomomyces lativittatus]
MAIRNAAGTRPSLFIPEAAFDVLVKPQIAQLEAPSLHCVEHVYEALLRMTHDCVGSELQRYPKLKEKVIEGVTSLLKEQLSPASQFIEQLVGIQCAYINTNHPDFIGGNTAIARLEKKQELEKRKRDSVVIRRKVEQGSVDSLDVYSPYLISGGSTPPIGLHVEGTQGNVDASHREAFMIDLIRILLGSYFAIVKKSLMDTVPKAIMHFLVNQTKWALQNRLVQALYKDELIPELLEEDKVIVAQRQQCLALLEVYRRALDTITQVLA